MRPETLRVLFVDDEPRILQGIQRALFPPPPHWEFAFEHSGERGLAKLEQFAADAVVTDMKMPGMDGAALLTAVQQRWPAVLRVVLSGQVDADAALRMIGVAHQFVSKPCDTESLLKSLERLLALQELLRSEAMRGLIGGLGSLPAAPRIYMQLTRGLADHSFGAGQVAGLIGQDPGMAAKVLQLANSVFFGRGKRVDGIRDAVSRLGVNNLRHLVLSSEVFCGANRSATIERLQGRSLLASMIAQRLPTPPAQGQLAQTAALLAEVGLLLPDIEARCADAAKLAGTPVTAVQAGAYLLGLWQIALPIVDAVAHHEAPAGVTGGEFDLVGVVHVAVRLAQEHEPDVDYLRRVGVLEQLPAWRDIAAELRGAASTEAETRANA